MTAPPHPLRAWRAALLATLALVPFAPPAAAQDAPCPSAAHAPSAQQKPQKAGLGGLLSAARNAGLTGVLAGAVRGERDLELELEQMARVAGERALTSVAEAAACRVSGEPAAMAGQVQNAVDLYTRHAN